MSVPSNLEMVAAHHNGEDNGSHCRLEDPEESQTQALDESEEVDTSLGDVPQVDQVRLVLAWHQEQLQTVHELKQHNRHFFFPLAITRIKMNSER